MKRFRRGDLAITTNSRAPLINDGHLVNILAVHGPDPERKLAFGYVVERVDGQPFALAMKNGIPIPVAGDLRLFADQYQLRPLRERPEETVEVVSARASA